MAGKWSTRETKFLTDNYYKLDEKEIALKLNRSVSSVQAKARKLGLYKNPEKAVEVVPEVKDKVLVMITELLDRVKEDYEDMRAMKNLLRQQIEENAHLSNRDVLAFAKVFESLVSGLERLSKIINNLEEKKTEITNVNIDMRNVNVLQIVNEEVKDPEIKQRISERLMKLSDELMVP